ncbi:MAG: tol-pal system-associated acyl-CoA thioesterase [Hyphomicrobiales bacterium]|nr:tol-pal system-associated acyl-CoA thioesterase [Hyphomicrobiales bacterium]
MPSPHVFPVRVYYEDTDFSGVVYHASYLRFMERARTELLRARGVHQQAIHDGAAGEAFGFAVRRMEIDFLKPARMDDLLSVETRARAIGGASLDLEQRVLRASETLIVAQVRIACVAGGRPFRLPAWVREKLAGG